MATQAQIVANQANAKKSTGPKSAEGKARVAQNAVKHGLTSTHVVRADTKEDRKDLKDLDDGLRAELNPQGALENLAFLDLLHAAWNLHRSRHMEAELGRGEPKDFYGPAFTWLDRIARYQTRLSARLLPRARRVAHAPDQPRPPCHRATPTKHGSHTRPGRYEKTDQTNPIRGRGEASPAPDSARNRAPRRPIFYARRPITRRNRLHSRPST